MITVRCPTMAALAGLCAGVHVPIVVEAVDDMRPAVALLFQALEREAFLVGRLWGSPQRPFTAANDPVPRPWAMMKAAVCVDVEPLGSESCFVVPPLSVQRNHDIEREIVRQMGVR